MGNAVKGGSRDYTKLQQPGLARKSDDGEGMDEPKRPEEPQRLGSEESDDPELESFDEEEGEEIKEPADLDSLEEEKKEGSEDLRDLDSFDEDIEKEEEELVRPRRVTRPSKALHQPPLPPSLALGISQSQGRTNLLQAMKESSPEKWHCQLYPCGSKPLDTIVAGTAHLKSGHPEWYAKYIINGVSSFCVVIVTHAYPYLRITLLLRCLTSSSISRCQPKARGI